jgi:secreted trypsin-like serine protease
MLTAEDRREDKMPIREMILAAVFTSLGMICGGAQAQQTINTLERLKAAEVFAAKLAVPGSSEFEDYRRRALEMAITPLATPRAMIALPSAIKRVSIDDDSRFKANTLHMVRQTTSGVQPRIFGGTLVVASAYPDAVSVQGPGGYCTGTLIAPNVVLTAAHCQCGNVNKTVVIGINLQRPDQVISVVRGIAMNGCTDSLPGKDVALLFLEKSPTNVSPRVFAKAASIANIVDVVAVGFGLTERGTSGIKLMTDIPVASSACNGSADGIDDVAHYGCAKDTELVAGMQNLNKDTCHGDSGGPIYIKTSEGEHLVGATSRGIQTKGAADCGDGGVYELLQGAILEWIEKTNGVAVRIAQ